MLVMLHRRAVLLSGERARSQVHGPFVLICTHLVQIILRVLIGRMGGGRRQQRGWA